MLLITDDRIHHLNMFSAAPFVVSTIFAGGFDALCYVDMQVHKFSKFIHGTSVLLPDMVQAVPYWIDDESIRKSIVQSSAQG